MRRKLFLDTNVLVSGIFFEGNESKILEMPELDLYTCDDAVTDLRSVVTRKLSHLSERTLEVALLEVERALGDITIFPKESYQEKVPEAKKLIQHENDVPILAAALYAKVDWVITGDAHFFTDTIRAVIEVRTARQFLEEI